MASSDELTILVVDDEPSIRNILKLMLSKKNLSVITAKDGVEALEKYEINKDRIKFVITDVVMPRINGYELAKSLMEQDPKLPILFISGYNSSKEIQHLVKKHSHIGYKSKPFGVEEIIKVMNEINPNDFIS